MFLIPSIKVFLPTVAGGSTVCMAVQAAGTTSETLWSLYTS